jgi:LacI family transcriptional regulator
MEKNIDTATQRKRSRQRSGRPTVSDVAAHANVSTATVSRCLSKPEHVSPEVKERVEASILELGYVLDGAAKALKTDRSETIGVIVPTLEIGSFALAIQALEKTLSAANYITILAVSDFDAEKELRLARNLAQQGVDAIMMIGQDNDDRLVKFLDKIKIPHVSSWDIGHGSKSPYIGFDNRAGLRRITEYVLDHGHTDVVLVVGGGAHANARTKHRRSGFEDAMTARGLAVSSDIIYEMPYDPASGQLALELIWDRPGKPTAIVCASDIFALGVLRACKQRGISIPDDVSVTGFDGLDIMADLWVPVTSMSVPAREMGEDAATYLLNILQNKHTESFAELHCTLVAGASVKSLT